MHISGPNDSSDSSDSSDSKAQKEHEKENRSVPKNLLGTDTERVDKKLDGPNRPST